MKIETENNQLFIHYNMSDLENWNPRPAVLQYNSKYSTISNKHKRFIKIY